jgi:hypothetical protein
MRRLYFDGETNFQRPLPRRFTWTIELPTESCSSCTWAAFFGLPFGLYPCRKNGSGYSWLTKRSPSRLPRSGK